MNNRKKAAIILLVVLVIYTGAMIIFAYPWEKFPDNFTEAKDGVVMISTEKRFRICHRKIRRAGGVHSY